MSVIVVPGQFSRDAHPTGKLAATLLGVAMAGMAEPGRFRRAKACVADRSVTRLELMPGILRATCRGSHPEPYQVIVSVPSVAPPATADPASWRSQMTRLVPDGDDILFSCTCPDEGDPCKHGIAAVLALAQEITGRPELILAWRCGDGPEVRSRRRTDAARPATPVGERRPPPAPRVDPYATPEWRAFVGAGSPTPRPPHLPSQTSAVKRSAIDVTGAEALTEAMLDALVSVTWR